MRRVQSMKSLLQNTKTYLKKMTLPSSLNDRLKKQSYEKWQILMACSQICSAPLVFIPIIYLCAYLINLLRLNPVPINLPNFAVFAPVYEVLGPLLLIVYCCAGIHRLRHKPTAHPLEITILDNNDHPPGKDVNVEKPGVDSIAEKTTAASSYANPVFTAEALKSVSSTSNPISDIPVTGELTRDVEAAKKFELTSEITPRQGP